MQRAHVPSLDAAVSRCQTSVVVLLPLRLSPSLSVGRPLFNSPIDQVWNTHTCLYVNIFTHTLKDSTRLFCDSYRPFMWQVLEVGIKQTRLMTLDIHFNWQRSMLLQRHSGGSS